MTPADIINHQLSTIHWDKAPIGLYEPIGYTLASGGKRLRPQLVLLAAHLYTNQLDTILPAALAIEIFHNFTLLHDDVMDNAPIRRGRPAVHVQWNTNTAILSGDQMMIEAYKQLAKLPAAYLPQVLEWFNEMATEICEGQQWDVDFESMQDVQAEQYLHMIRQKTSVLLGNALRTGAYLAGASMEDCQYLYDFGIYTGLAFQIQDDILDVYGDPKTFGKAIGGDITINKKTLMLITALKRAEGTDLQNVLHSWIEKNEFDTSEKIAAVTTIYNTLQVREICENTMRDFTQSALESLDKVRVADEKKQDLRQLALNLLARNE